MLFLFPLVSNTVVKIQLNPAGSGKMELLFLKLAAEMIAGILCQMCNSIFHCYADDTVIYCTSSTPAEALKYLQQVQEQLCHLQLVLNANRNANYGLNWERKVLFFQQLMLRIKYNWNFNLKLHC